MSIMSAVMNNALSGALAYQTAISVTSNNIANVDTEGYCRESAYIQEGVTGVNVSEIKRVTDEYIDNLTHQASQQYGDLESRSKYVQSLETLFNDLEGYGLSDALDEYWNAWLDVASDPDDLTSRSTLVAAGQDLAETFNLLDSQLTGTGQEVDRELQETVETVNELTSDLAELNQGILKAESMGQDTGSLEDRRDTYIRDLAALVDITTCEQSDGQVVINLADGSALVQGDKSWNLEVELNAVSDRMELVWNDGGGGSVNLGSAIEGGELGGLMTVRNELLPEAFASLDELAGEIIARVNGIHQAGYDLNGDAGEAFFTGTNAGDIAVNRNIVDDVSLVAASSSAAGSPGDGTNAEALAELESALTMNGGASTFGEYYNQFIVEWGNRSESIQAKLEEQAEWVSFYESYRESVSGVSADEETAKLIQYQTAYEASLKVIGILEEMLQTVINM